MNKPKPSRLRQQKLK
jgi:hypothetical protein